MPCHSIPDSFRKTCVNSIHPEVESIDGTSKVGTSTFQTEKCADYDDLFSSDVLRCAKSYLINVRADRLIHIQHYVPNNNVLDRKNAENDKGQDSAVVLFFIHGVGGSWKIWDAQIQNFAREGYEIIAFDMLGHGLSSRPDGYKPYEFHELALDVLFVFDKFCKRRNVLIGHSYGTSFCVLLSTERGNLISKMVLISGGGPTSLRPDRCSAFCLPLPILFLILPLLLKFFRRMAFHVKTRQIIQDQISTFGVSAHVLKAVMQGQNWEESDEQYHSDLTVPALLVYGSGDKFVALADEVWMNETIYSSRLEVIEDAGHMVMVEAPSEVNRLILEFLNRDASTRIDKHTSSNVNNTMSSERSDRLSPLNTAINSVQRNESFVDNSVQNTPSKRSSSRLSRLSSASKSRGKKMF